MHTEDELLPISALQHLAFCERQWALIHLEGLWEENRLTVEGQFLHERAHEAETEVRGKVRIARGLRLRSLRLGLVGKADVVEFHRTETDDSEHSIQLDNTDGLWRPVIVEYKRGKPKLDHCDEVQLCAQAFCLEEMLKVSIPSGILFYGKTRRRYEVLFSETLRTETEALAKQLHDMTWAGKTPRAHLSPKCKSCSLVNLCLPMVSMHQSRMSMYLSKAIAEAVKDT